MRMNEKGADKVQQEFDLHISFLTEIGKSFVTNTGITAGFLITVTGWVATSKDAQKVLVCNPGSKYVAATAVIASCALYAFGSWLVYRSLTRTYQRLLSLKYLPESAFRERGLRPAAFASCVLGVASIGLLVVILLFSQIGAP